MLEKFKKKFGPNRTEFNSFAQDMTYADTIGDPFKRERDAKSRTRHRVVGFLVVVCVSACVLPWIFEPDMSYSQSRNDAPVVTSKDELSVKRVDVKPVRAQAPVAEERSIDIQTRNAKVAQSLAKPNISAPIEVKRKAEEPPKAETALKTSVGSITGSSIPRVETRKDHVKQAVSVKDPARIVQPNPAPVVKASSTGSYFIQVIATGSINSAKDRAERLKKLGLPVYLEEVKRRDTNLWRVRVGRFSTQQEARVAADILALNAISNGGVMQERHK